MENLFGQVENLHVLTEQMAARGGVRTGSSEGSDWKKDLKKMSTQIEKLSRDQEASLSRLVGISTSSLLTQY